MAFIKQSAFWLRLVCCFSLCAFSFQLKAQTFSEWFAQKSTQKKYLLLQIEALQQYGSYIRQGYQISQNGLGSIGGWVKSEFDLHGAHYSALRTVNPSIKNNPKANDCINDALGISKLFSSLPDVSGEAVIQNHIKAVKATVLSDTDADISELELVMTDGLGEFSDDERLRRLDSIHSRLNDRYAYSRRFCDEVRSLLMQHGAALKDAATERGLYGN
jgi:hypothetical protein